MRVRNSSGSIHHFHRDGVLDEETLNDLKDELLYAQQVARDEDGRVLVWTSPPEALPAPAPAASQPAPPPMPQDISPLAAAPGVIAPQTPEAERRQLTVLFCDLVDSTALANQLDPEDLRAVVRAYQETCAKVIARFEGHIAQYLGDGLLVYFGYPLAHEDDAQRAVRAGLGIVEAMRGLNTRLEQEGLRPAPIQSRQRGVRLAVRLGVHTGLVVVGEVGGGSRQELDMQIALGQAWMAAKGQGVPEVERAYTRARELCRHVGATPELFPVLLGLWRFYLVRAEYQTARELAEQCLSLAQRAHAPALLLVAHYALGATVYLLGEVALARIHQEQAIALYDPTQHHPLAFRYGMDLGVWCLSYVAWHLWLLGYPAQALTRSREAITLAQELSHPHSLASALD